MILSGYEGLCSNRAAASFTMTPDLQALLTDYQNGEPGALDKLMPHIYADLRRLARRHVHQWPGLTLGTTLIVHEAYLKMSRQSVVNATDKSHLLAICAQAMRQYVIVHARQRMTVKRGVNPVMIDIDGLDVPVDDGLEQLMLIDQALKGLAQLDIRLVRVFECRYFAGLTEEETARALNLSVRTVQRAWMRARAWIADLVSVENK